VQIAFMVGALLLFWLLDKLATTLWGIWGEPDTTLVTGLSAVVAGLTAWRVYRNARVHEGTFEVVGELVKVTWPSRKETSASTVVVIITSVIVAVLLGLMDAFWSSVTDFIY
jgi:preprotein translocase subunit SecE